MPKLKTLSGREVVKAAMGEAREVENVISPFLKL